MKGRRFVHQLASIACLAFAICATASCTRRPAAAKSEWPADYAKAAVQAKAEHKLLVLDFTGSDWCPPCQALDRAVFSTAKFRDYAAKNLVFVEVDFPRGKPQPPEVAVQNEELAHRFGIEVFPSIIVLDSAGKKLGALIGYDPGGVDAFIAKLEAWRKS